MRHLLFIVFFLTGSITHADVVCRSADGKSGLVYKASPRPEIGTMDLVILNGTAPSRPDPIRITATHNKAGANASQVIWIYEIDQGRVVEIVWISQDLGNELVTTYPESAVIKRGGEVLGTYPSCSSESLRPRPPRN